MKKNQNTFWTERPRPPSTHDKKIVIRWAIFTYLTIIFSFILAGFFSGKVQDAIGMFSFLVFVFGLSIVHYNLLATFVFSNTLYVNPSRMPANWREGLSSFIFLLVLICHFVGVCLFLVVRG